MSKLLILVGCPGSGKTHLAKTIIKKVHKSALHIFDVNAEYTSFFPYDFNPDKEIFIEKASRLKSAVILMEDATGFLPVNGRDNLLVQCLQGKFHSKNTFILLFHSMQDLPKYILRFCNTLFIFKTLDSPKYVKSIFGETQGNSGNLYEAWKTVYDQSQNNAFFETRPPRAGLVPPMKVFQMY